MLRCVLVFIALVLEVVAVHAADICEAVALRDVSAIENPESVLHKGDVDTAVTQYRVDDKTGGDSICSHGGYCYPMHARVGGALVETLRLTNCKVSYKHPDDFDGETVYGLDVIRSKVPADTLRYNDVDDRLSSMRLCNACAHRAASLYLEKPRSSCATLVREALHGNRRAIGRLVADPNPCYPG